MRSKPIEWLMDGRMEFQVSVEELRGVDKLEAVEANFKVLESVPTPDLTRLFCENCERITINPPKRKRIDVDNWAMLCRHCGAETEITDYQLMRNG